MPAPPIPILQTPETTPPAYGTIIVPHQQTFSSVYNTFSNTYRYSHDEALLHSRENAIRMRFDPVIMEPLETRLRATAQLTWHIEPDDPADPAQVEAAAQVEKRIRRMPRLQDVLMWLNEAAWFGRSGVQVLYDWKRIDGQMGIIPVDHIPINGDKLVFGYQPVSGRPGRVGVRVTGLYDGTWEPTDYGAVHFFTEQERQSVLVHRYRPEDADFSRPWKAGAIQGQGLRERLYWFWANKDQTFGFLADYIRWFAQGITVYYYPAGNAKGYDEALQRAREAQGQSYLLWPRWSDEDGPKYKPFDRLDPSTASTNLLQSLTAGGYYDQVIRRMILATGGTTLGGPSGLGSDTANVLERTADQVIKYDAAGLQDTLSADLVPILYAWTYPGVPPGRWVFEIDSPNVEQFIMAATFFTDRGGQIGADTTRKALGLPAPKPGEPILGQLQAQQPAAVDGTPQGVPIVQGGAPDSGGASGAPDPGPAVPSG